MAIRFSSYIQSIINHYVYVTHPLSLCIFGGSVIKIDFSSGIFLPVSKNMGRTEVGVFCKGSEAAFNVPMEQFIKMYSSY